MWYGDWGARGALYWPEETAIVEVVPGTTPGSAARTRRFTYAALDVRANKVAAWLRDHAGVRAGDKVGMIAMNGVEVLDVLFACGKLGAVLVPYNWRLHAAELGELVRRTAPKVVFYSEELQALAGEALAFWGGSARTLPALVHLEGPGLPGSTAHEAVLATSRADPISNPAFRETDVACLLFTGGTTGLPKAARITYRQIAWNTFTTMVHEIRPGDVTITHTPMFHTGGLFVYTVPFLSIGGRVVLMRRWDAALALKLLQDEKVTAFFAVPTQYQQLLEAPGFAEADLSRIRYLTSGGAAMPGPLRAAWAGTHPIPFKQGFGMTEFGPGVFSFPASEADRKAGSIGLVNQFIEARLVDEDGRDVKQGEVGELLLRGPACCDGYEGPDGSVSREGIDAEGWLHSGDLMRQDEDRYFWVAGRRKDMFISGGENVYPLEVENALLTHPAVAMASVVGVPDAKWGEVGHAFYTLKPGAVAEPDALLEHLRTRLAKYKVPKQVTRVDAMPLSAAGKILKTELRKLAVPGGKS
ncbi:MAG: AMP-binding protein [Anaeromyxobacteraceae bacterium]